MKKNPNLKRYFSSARSQKVDQAWIASWRATLAKHVSDYPITEVSKGQAAESGLPNSLFIIRYKFMLPIIIAVAVAITGGGAAVASQNDLPGDALYPVKLVTEDVRESFAFSKEKKAELKTAFAERRAEELAYLANNSDVDVDKVVSTAQRYRELIREAKDLVKELPAEKRLTLAPGLAKRINVSAAELEVNNNNATTTAELTEATEDAEEAENEILEAEEDAAEETPEVLAAEGQTRAAGKIKAAENKLAEVTRYTAKFTTSTDVVSSTLAEATTLLAEAKTLYEAGSYNEAFFKAGEAHRAANDAKKSIRESLEKLVKTRAEEAKKDREDKREEQKKTAENLREAKKQEQERIREQNKQRLEDGDKDEDEREENNED